MRLVDDRTAAGDWAGLRAARDRCRAAVATGRQLWPAATLAEYRLALVAPPTWAAPMIAEDAGLFTIGPLTEVIAQHHTWAELQPLLPATPGAAVVAHERVAARRGDRCRPSVADLPDVFDLPYTVAPWEPAYPLATYSDDGVDAPPPPDPTSPAGRARAGAPPAERLDDDAVELAVRQLVETWTASSNGRAEVACVDGTPATMPSPPSALSDVDEPPADASPKRSPGWPGRAPAGAPTAVDAARPSAASAPCGCSPPLLDLTDDWPVPARRARRAGPARCAGRGGTPGVGRHGWRLQLAVEDATTAAPGRSAPSTPPDTARRSPDDELGRQAHLARPAPVEQLEDQLAGAGGRARAVAGGPSSAAGSCRRGVDVVEPGDETSSGTRSPDLATAARAPIAS